MAINTLPGARFAENQARLAQRQARGGTGERFLANHPRFAARQAAVSQAPAQQDPQPAPTQWSSAPMAQPQAYQSQQPLQQEAPYDPNSPGGRSREMAWAQPRQSISNGQAANGALTQMQQASAHGMKRPGAYTQSLQPIGQPDPMQEQPMGNQPMYNRFNGY